MGLGGGALVAACGTRDEPAPHIDRWPTIEREMPCPGVCREEGLPGVPDASDPWRGPELIWRGKPSEAPSCSSVGMRHPAYRSENDPATYYAGQDYYSDPKPGGACPGCECTPPLCALPEHIDYTWIYTDDPKNRPGERCDSELHHSAHDGFEPAGFWDGTCLRHDAVPVAPMAAVLMSPSSQSQRCDPFESPAGVDALVGTLWRVCRRDFELESECVQVIERCLPPVPEGFRYCLTLWTAGDPDREHTACPPSYPERSRVSSYIGGCDRCACTTVTTPECTASLSRYRDPDCKDLIRTDTILEPQANFQWTFYGRTCLEMPTEGTVGGVSATLAVDREGACEATGGDQHAEPYLENDYILCCEAPPGG
ncbi:hypothetical protein BE20_35890 [Sorangium cellulosum]|uniref:Uncharacterized protein n=1 Tax=Sorangium cellulosum TaxID=56 RepID=A0A150RRJ2_SORCE|nr:hypothetical protein BE18_35830 [Sorangium cellulosum]KYF98195.1 hypothetical protein BE20_35890 [Sorangium cellulosum]